MSENAEKILTRPERRARNRIATHTIDAERALARLQIVVAEAVIIGIASTSDAKAAQQAINVVRDLAAQLNRKSDEC